jgi:hypothetical protein
MINLFKAFFKTQKAKNNKTKKINPIADRIEIKETPANTWWS